MLNKLLLGLAGVLFAAFAWAVDVNTASQAELESIKGIGPKTAAAIIAERKKGGSFKNTQDLADRVKGVGNTNVEKFKAAGLTVAGEKSSAAPAEKVTTKKEAKPADKAPVAAKDEKKTSEKDSKKKTKKDADKSK
ncbi:MAG: helix-hairpin-helix domain-containing protein [Burkholderiaceae bacterium]|nr:MAG: helix-hairpin-helix domain-containing protein [Burkholderiaceae bacterium]